MGEGFINLNRFAWLFGIAVLVMVANIVVSILYMVVYSYFIDPGHGEQYYDAHIQVAGPYCSIAGGIPLMFLAGYWIGGWWQGKFAIKSALAVWLVYALIDVTVLVSAGLTPRIGMLAAVSLVTKLAAIYLGTVIRDRGIAA